MSKAIQRVEEPKTLTLSTARATDMKGFLEEEKEIRALVREYIRDQMVKGVDYGPMPGVKAREGETEKNVLFKPGAEKLFDIFRCKPEYRVTRTIDAAVGLYSFEIRCRAAHRDTDQVMNEGLGSASSYESKYRYRAGERKCPACEKVGAIRKSATEFYCWRKLDGCGATFALNAPAILDQQVGKVQNPDLADVSNTVLKMAKKRAQVDCAIGLARVSDLFTADLEDLPTIEVEAKPALPEPAKQPTAPVVNQPTEKITPSPEQRAAARDLTEKAAAAQEAPRFNPQLLWKRLTHGRNTAQALAFMRQAVGDPNASVSSLTQEQLETVSAELDLDGAPQP